MQVELKPCPFCGGEATLRQWPDLEAIVGCKEPDRPSYWAVCPECEGMHPPYYDRNEVIAAWNRRAGDSHDQ